MEISDLLVEFLQGTISTLPNKSNLKYFDAKEVPSIKIKDYIKRFNDYLNIEQCIYVVAYIFIDRLLKENARLEITSLNVHRLLVTAITIADKNYNDCYWRNTDYAIVGAISNEELNSLEVIFLQGINFDTNVDQDEYIKALTKITRNPLLI